MQDKKIAYYIGIGLLIISNISPVLATTINDNNNNVVPTEELDKAPAVTNSGEKEDSSNNLVTVEPKETASSLNNSTSTIVPVSSEEEATLKNSIIHEVGAYFYTVDNSQPVLETGWSLSEFKYPDGFESGTITYDELIEGLIGHVVMGHGITSTVKDTVNYISQVTNGQITLEEFEQKTGYALSSTDLEELTPYMGYSLYEVDYKNNLSQLVTQTDPTVEVQLGIPFVKNDSKITIHYIMEDGTSAFEDRVITGAKGITPDSVVKSPLKEGYVADKPSVLVHMDGEQEITVTYKTPPIKGENVIAKYVDENNKSISENVVYSGNIGEEYTTDQKVIEGYTFKEVQGNSTGKFTDQSQTVIYVYTQNPIAGGEVTTEYVDTNGKSISEPVVKSGNVGEDYTTDQKAIEGYTFKEVKGNASGQFTDQPQSIIYVYAKEKKTNIVSSISDDNKSMQALGQETELNNDTNKTSLPDTGESKSMIITIIGMVLVLLTGIAIVYNKKGRN